MWSEIDRGEPVWTVPASRMKSARPHHVPLCGQALEILDAARKLGGGGSRIVFVGKRGREMGGEQMGRLTRGSAPSTPDRSALRRKSTGCHAAPASGAASSGARGWGSEGGGAPPCQTAVFNTASAGSRPLNQLGRRRRETLGLPNHHTRTLRSPVRAVSTTAKWEHPQGSSGVSEPEPAPPTDADSPRRSRFAKARLPAGRFRLSPVLGMAAWPDRL